MRLVGVLAILLGVCFVAAISLSVMKDVGLIADVPDAVAAIVFAPVFPLLGLIVVLVAGHRRRAWGALSEALLLAPEGKPLGAKVRLDDVLAGRYGRHDVEVQVVRYQIEHRNESARATRFVVSALGVDPSFWLHVGRRDLRRPVLAGLTGVQSRVEVRETRLGKAVGWVLLSDPTPETPAASTGTQEIDRVMATWTNDEGKAGRLVQSPQVQDLLAGKEDKVLAFLVDSGRVIAVVDGIAYEVDKTRVLLDRLCRFADELARTVPLEEATTRIPPR